ncbi:hypothetical protein GCM10010430_76460 [Kitasatospora cystarginea]|uniref:Uncharacterized protein n=1 Tax=Kitasatospora cystarginea TaxID=58350 RepID=A0ABN3F0Q6_9ACTN
MAVAGAGARGEDAAGQRVLAGGLPADRDREAARAGLQDDAVAAVPGPDDVDADGRENGDRLGPQRPVPAAVQRFITGNAMVSELA